MPRLGGGRGNLSITVRLSGLWKLFLRWREGRGRVVFFGGGRGFVGAISLQSSLVVWIVNQYFLQDADQTIF